MRVFQFCRVLAFSSLFSFPVTSQTWVSEGVKGGLPLTAPFAERSFVSISPAAPPSFLSTTTTVSSGPRTIIIGPTFELGLPLGLSLEADALYRQTNYRFEQSKDVVGGFTILHLLSGPSIPNHMDTWEFPLLAKYKIAVPLAKPYLEAGSIFRAKSASLAQHRPRRTKSRKVYANEPLQEDTGQNIFSLSRVPQHSVWARLPPENLKSGA